MIPRSMVTGNLWMALGGWFSAADRDVYVVPNGYSRAEQERGMQTGANKLAEARSIFADRRASEKKLIGFSLQGLKKSSSSVAAFAAFTARS